MKHDPRFMFYNASESGAKDTEGREPRVQNKKNIDKREPRGRTRGESGRRKPENETITTE